MTNMYCFQPPFRSYIRLLLGSRYFYEKSRSPWEKSEEDINAMMDRIREDAAKFKKQFEADVQFIFSRVQHHWHPKNKKGDREAPKYCKPKGKACLQCKRGFPKRVMCDKFGKIRPEKYRVRVVCKGVASEMHLQVSGRRNMLGSILGKRRCPWFAPTAKVLSHVFRSNTNVQTNYRMPLTEHTHDRDCQKKECLSPEQNKKMILLCQRAMSSQLQSFGRFGSVNDSLFRYSRFRQGIRRTNFGFALLSRNAWKFGEKAIHHPLPSFGSVSVWYSFRFDQYWKKSYTKLTLVLNEWIFWRIYQQKAKGGTIRIEKIYRCVTNAEG